VTETRLTVGAALHQGHVIEFRLIWWWQLMIRMSTDGPTTVVARFWRTEDDSWSSWRFEGRMQSAMPSPCRLVPIADADADPTTRGPIGDAP
jgi:hypothetical protein